MFSEIGRLCTALLDLMLPRVCVVCACRLILPEKHICSSCLSDMPLTRNWDIRENEMSERFNALVEESLSCPAEPYSYAAALIFYSSEENYKNIPQNLKYNADLAGGRFFASMLGRSLAASPLFADVDCIIPVPLHRSRRLTRGYNQAEIIARELASALGAPLRCDILIRSRRTRSQTELDVDEKKKNVADAFSVKRKPVAVRHILLVDDVFTTGATLNACRVALRRAGVGAEVRISVATLALAGSV